VKQGPHLTEMLVDHVWKNPAENGNANAGRQKAIWGWQPKIHRGPHKPNIEQTAKSD